MEINKLLVKVKNQSYKETTVRNYHTVVKLKHRKPRLMS